jgi:UDP-GlcNAc:undecaprenyl-phosphate GlcNAc-1-phosphate transferase
VAAAATLGHGEVVLLGAVLLGALAGFLPHNFNPARIFLGDSGSLFIGFNLAVLSVHGSMKSPTAVLVAVPLFALAIPLLDTVVAMARRWLRGFPISQADARHIHHRLLALGLSHRDAVLVLYVVAAAFAGLGVLLGFAPPRRVALIAGLGGTASAAILVVGMRRLGYDEFLLAGKVVASGPRRAREVIRSRILAEDMATVIGAARSLEEIQAVLADAAPDLGLLHMDVSGRGAGCNGWRPPPGTTAWKLDFPLCPYESSADPRVLRLRVATGDDQRPAGAERVAHVLAPAIRERLEALDLQCGGCQKCDLRPTPGDGDGFEVATVLSA